MKQKLLFGCLLLLGGMVNAQVKVGNNPTVVTPSAVLDVESTTKGFLMPRMTTAQRTAIATPATGLQVYDTDTNSVWYYNGTAWTQLISSSTNLYNTDGSLTGNRTVTLGANTLNFTGTGNLTFNSGNVGIGSAGPTHKLVVVKGTAVTPVYTPSTTAFAARFIGNTSSNNVAIENYNTGGIGSAIMLMNANGTETAPTAILANQRLGSVIARGYDGTTMAQTAEINIFATEDFSATAGGTRILFNTTANGTKTPIERVRIDQNGNMGIGTFASPTATLDVNGTVRIRSGAAAGFVLQSAADGTASWVAPGAVDANNIYNIDGTLTGNRTVTQDANSLTFTGTGNTLFNSGNVGVGTTSPGNKFEVIVNNASEQQVSLFANIGGGAATVGIGGTSGAWTKLASYGGRFGIRNYANTEMMTVSMNSGNVGIGQTLPLFKLHVVTDDNSDQLVALFSNINTGTSAQTTVGIGSATGAWTKLASYSGNFGIRNYTTNAEFVTVNLNNGNVGIGSAAPTHKLVVVKGTAVSPVYTPSTTAFAARFIGNTSSNNVAIENYNTGGIGSAIILMNANGTETAPTAILANQRLGSVIARGYDGTTMAQTAEINVIATEDFSATAGGTGILFSTTANGTKTPTERLRIDQSGNVGIGTNSPAASLHVNSTGSIIIPVGADANRPTSPVRGMIRFNTTSSRFEGYDGSAWVNLN